MSIEEMRRLGYQVVDEVLLHLANKSMEPAIQTGDVSELREALGGPIPQEPGNIDTAIRTLVDVALLNQQHGDHPRYFARVPGPSSFAGVLGDWLATGFNTIATSWVGGSGPATVELIVVDWIRQLMRMPEGTEGVLVSGGSMGNLTAFATARSAIGAGVVYLTDQTHSSVRRALDHLGFSDDGVRIIETDDEYRMSAPALAAAMAQDVTEGRRPMAVVGTAGTTNTGAVDPLDEIATLCEKHGCWFHVDGAYGATAMLTDRSQPLLRGIERADSVVLDPHKWLFQPYDVGCVLVRRPGALQRAFSMTPEYLKDGQAHDAQVDFRDRSLELTRRSRAIKLWLAFHAYGVRRMTAAIERGLELAAFAESHIRSLPDVWDLVTAAQLGVVTFALKNATPGLHAARAARLAETGFAVVTSTMLNGRSALRLCTLNPLTTEDDLRETIDMLAQAD